MQAVFGYFYSNQIQQLLLRAHHVAVRPLLNLIQRVRLVSDHLGRCDLWG